MGRRSIEISGSGVGGRASKLIHCKNVPFSIEAVVTAKYATLHELQTVYGLEDLYDLLELVAVDKHNDRVIKENADRH